MSGGKTIMVVDDDLDIIEALSVIVESAGYDVITAESSDDCLALLETVTPDLFILDIMMESVTDGFNLVGKLKAKPAVQNKPIIVVSSIEKFTGITIDKNMIQISPNLDAA